MNSFVSVLLEYGLACVVGHFVVATFVAAL